jgi:predicted  nucleic acid-binding Zn-ribbon protein
VTELLPHAHPLKTMETQSTVTATAESAELARAVSALATELVSLRTEVAALRAELAAQAERAAEREALLRAQLLAIAEALGIV